MRDERVVAIYDTTSNYGSDRWRIEYPFRNLIAQGYDAWLLHPSEAHRLQGGKLIRALVQPRIGFTSRKMARLMRLSLDTTNTRLVIDMDDRLDAITRHNDWHRVNAAWRHNLYALEVADAITVTTEDLAWWVRSDLGMRCEVHVVPNRVPPNFYRPMMHERLTVGLIGAPQHQQDWNAIARPVQRIVDLFPNIRLLVVGGQPPAGVHGANVEARGWQEWELYRSSVGEVDIALCPLQDTRFNWGRSPLKWVEFGSIGVPCIVSPTVFGRVVRDGDDAFVARAEADWFGLVAALIEDEDLRRRIGQAAKRRIEAEFTENAATAASLWKVLTGESPWKLEKSLALSSSPARRSLSFN